MYRIVDIETTGGNAATGGITEISVYSHDGEKITGHFSTLINPVRTIPLFITTLTGITNEMVADAPVFEDVAEELYHLLDGSVFVAHSANFDHSFIKYQLQLAGYDLKVKKLCTVRLSRKAFPGIESYSLGNLCRRLKIPITNRHRADGDARATVSLFEMILQANGLEIIKEMLRNGSGDQWLPMLLDKQMINSLPNKPGVYYFHDAKGKIIYVGKAKILRKRVRSHFTNFNPGERRQHFLRHITKVTYIECANELHALVLESTEIKRLWPKYNYSQKEPLIKFGLYSYYDSRGYLHLAIDKKRKNFPCIYTFNIYEDGRKTLKEFVDQSGLHAKFCHLDTNQITEEDFREIGDAENYNSRVTTAVNEFITRLKSFALLEHVPGKRENVCLLMEKGSFWGMGYIPQNQQINSIDELKTILEPLADNNFIRNSLFNFAAAYPSRVLQLNS